MDLGVADTAGAFSLAATTAPAIVPLCGSRQRLPVPLAALVFEMDDVLYDATPWQRWLLQLLARIGLHTHYTAFFRTWRSDHLAAVHRGGAEFWDALRTFLISAGISRGQVEEVLAAAHGKHRELAQSVRPFPQVAATLAQLSQRGMRLAVLSNAIVSARQLHERLDQLGLGGRFEVVLSSRDLKCAKPDMQCYQAAATALAIDTEHIGCVAHDAGELAGAALAGMTTFAVHPPADTEADFALARFDQLLALVLTQAPRRRAG